MLASASQQGDGTSTALKFAVPVPAGPSQICGTVSSAGKGGTVFDAIPTITQNGCKVGGLVILNGAIGLGGGWN